MRPLAIIVVAAAATLLAGPAAAQGGLELTPTLGYRWGGEISAGATDLFGVDMDVQEGTSWGLTLDIPLSRFMQLELMADRQATVLGRSGFLTPVGETVDVDLDYYHAGLLWHWSAGRSRPFVVASLGITRVDPDIPGIGADDRFSASLGGGFKVALNHRLAFRFEVRGVWTDTSEDSWWDDDWWDDCRHDSGCDSWDGWEDLVQGQARVGLSFTF